MPPTTRTVLDPSLGNSADVPQKNFSLLNLAADLIHLIETLV